MPATRKDVVREVRSWLGIPWRHQGRTREGVDCAGLIVCVGVALGVPGAEHDLRAYRASPDGRTLARLCRRAMVQRGKVNPRPGDVVLLRPPPKAQTWPTHLGIIVGGDGDAADDDLRMVHSYGCLEFPGGCVKESRFRPWSGRVVSVFTYRGVEE